MPDRETLKRARKDKRAGKSASTQAGEFVREEMHHVREGKHGARSTKQAIAIGLSKARRSGVKLGAPKRGASKRTRDQAVLAGNNSDNPELQYLPRDVDIKVGDRIVTSGVGGNFPVGLPVGEVTRVADGHILV